MILCRDQDFAAGQMFDRMVTTVMAKFQPACICAQGTPDQLVTEADSEDWPSAGD